MPVLLLVLGAEYGGLPVASQLRELHEHAPEVIVGLVQQPLVEHQHLEVAVLPYQLPGGAGLELGHPELLLQIGDAHVHGAHPPLACLLRQRAGQVALAAAREALEHDVVAAFGVAAGGELRDPHPVEPAIIGEVDPPDVGVRVPQVGALDQLLDLAVHERGMGLVDGHLQPLGEGHAHAHVVILRLDGAQQAARAHVPELPVGLASEHRHRPPPP